MITSDVGGGAPEADTHSDRTHARALSIRSYAICRFMCSMCLASPKFVPTKFSETKIPQTFLMLSTIIQAHRIMFRIPVLLVHFVCQSRMHTAQFPYSDSFVHQPRLHFAWNKCHSCSCINGLTPSSGAAHTLYPFAREMVFVWKWLLSTNSKLHAWKRVRISMVFA